MVARAVLTFLVDNAARRPELLSEHGLSIWVETRQHRVLFDTGQGIAIVVGSRQQVVDLGPLGLPIALDGAWGFASTSPANLCA
jgi:7,8-dihydropterin-6-yl-methyl-4-(beta-D-ribofuranosyl)aminobenzene 5'-phosphate synthase